MSLTNISRNTPGLQLSSSFLLAFSGLSPRDAQRQLVLLLGTDAAQVQLSNNLLGRELRVWQAASSPSLTNAPALLVVVFAKACMAALWVTVGGQSRLVTEPPVLEVRSLASET
jgi:hypothetical protein